LLLFSGIYESFRFIMFALVDDITIESEGGDSLKVLISTLTPTNTDLALPHGGVKILD
jgi:hypothetical protein